MLRAVEGPLAAVQGVRPDELEYGGAAKQLPEVWVAVRANLRDVLEHVTLADLADGQAAAGGDDEDRRSTCTALAKKRDAWRAGH